MIPALLLPMSRARLLFLGTALVAATTITSNAHACWDGRSASSERVNVAMPGEDTFDERDAREIADWLQRIEALLPPSSSVQAFGGFVTVCVTEVDCREAKWTQGRYAQLFDAVVGVLGSQPDAAGAARRVRATPWTVQVFASRSVSRAQAVAAKVDEPRELDHGYYVAGGFPAINPVAHVVRGTDASGGVIWRVIVGSYLERSQATAAEAKLQALGFKGFVRPL